MATAGRRPFTQMTIGLTMEGSQFSQTLKNINQQVKLAESNMKANLKILGNAEKSYDDLEKVLKDVQKAYDANEKKMRALNRAHEEAVEQYGENSAEARKYGVQINNLAGTMAVLDRQLKATNREMIYMEEGVEDVKKAMAAAKKEADGMAKAYKDAGRTVEAASETQKSLARELAQTEDLMAKQQKVIARMTAEFGENSDEVRRAQQSYANLGQSARELEVRLQGATDKLTEMGVEGAEAQARLQREMVATRSEIQQLEREMNGMTAGSSAFMNAEQRLASLRGELSRTEGQAGQLESALREIGNQPIDTGEVDTLNDRLGEATEQARGLSGVLAGLAGALAGSAMVGHLDNMISRMARLNQSAQEYQETLRSGVYSDEGTELLQNLRLGAGARNNAKGGTSTVNEDALNQAALDLEFVVKRFGGDAEDVSKLFNTLIKKGYSYEDATTYITKALQTNVKDLDSLNEYIITIEGFSPEQLLNNIANAKALSLTYNEDQAGDFYKEWTNEMQQRELDELEKIFGKGIAKRFSELQKQVFSGEKTAAEASPEFVKLVNEAAKGNQELATKMINQFMTKAEEMGGWAAVAPMLTGFDGVYDANGKPITGELSPDVERIKQASQEWDKLVGSVSALGGSIALTFLPEINKVLERMTNWIKVDENFEKLKNDVLLFIQSFRDGFNLIKDNSIVEWITDKVFGMFGWIADLLGGQESTISSVAKTLGILLGTLSALALINLPFKAIGMIAKVFGANGAISEFLSKGVLGKGASITKRIGEGVNSQGGNLMNYFSKDSRELRGYQREIATTRGWQDPARKERYATAVRDKNLLVENNPRAGKYRTNQTIGSQTKRWFNRKTESTIGNYRERNAKFQERYNARVLDQFSNGPIQHPSEVERKPLPQKKQRMKIFNRNQGITARMFTPEFEGRVAQAGARNRRAIGGAVGKVGNVAKGAVGAVGKVAGGAGKVLSGAMGALGGPLGIVMMALPIVLPLIKKLYNECEPFKKVVDTIWNSLKTFWAWLQPMLVQAGAWIKDKLVSAWDAMLPKIQWAWDKLKQFWAWLSPMLTSAWTAIKDKLGGVWDGIKEKLTTFWGYAKTAFSTIQTDIIPKLQGLWTKVKEVFNGIWTVVSPIVSKIWETVKSAFTNIKNFIFTTIPSIYNNIRTTFTNVWNVVKTIFTGIWNTIKTIINLIWTGIKMYLTFIFNAWKAIFTTIWNVAKTIFTGIWNTIKTIINLIWTGIKMYLSFIFNTWKVILTTIWNVVKTIFTAVWNTIKAVMTSIWNTVKSGMGWVKDSFSKGFNYVKDKAIGFKDSIVSNFTKVKDGIIDKVKATIDYVKSMPGKIADGFKSAAGAMKSAGATMINGLVGAVEGGINKVIDGINTALGWFGVAKKISKVNFGRIAGGNTKGKVGRGGAIPMYHSGTKPGGHKGGPAIINDAKGSIYRELVELPNGEMFIPKGRNLMVDLPKGSHVLDARKTKQVQGTGHIPAYAKGTKGAWDWTKEKVMGGINWVAEKIKSLADVKDKILGFVAKKIGFSDKGLNNQVVKGLGTKLIEGASSLIWGGKKNLDQSETGGLDASTGKYTGEGKSSGALSNLVNIVRNIISKYPGSRITSTLRPGARTAAGTLSDHALGKAVDVGGHGHNGSPTYHKIAEDFMKLPVGKYAIANNRWAWKNRFGWKGYPYGGHLNHVHLSAFRRGGFVNKPTFGMVGEDGAEAVIPMSKALRTRGLGLLHETANAMGYEVEEKNAAQQHNNELMMALIAEVQALREEVKKKDTNVYMDGRKVGEGVKVHERKDNIKTKIARGKY